MLQKRYEEILFNNPTTQKAKGDHSEILTPLWLADEIVQQLQLQNINKVIEPCCGKGVFLISIINKLLEIGKEYKFIVENIIFFNDLQTENIEICKKLLDPRNEFSLNYSMVDALTIDYSKYDLVITNPPYITSGNVFTNKSLYYQDFIAKFQECQQVAVLVPETFSKYPMFKQSVNIVFFKKMRNKYVFGDIVFISPMYIIYSKDHNKKMTEEIQGNLLDYFDYVSPSTFGIKTTITQGIKNKEQLSELQQGQGYKCNIRGKLKILKNTFIIVQLKEKYIQKLDTCYVVTSEICGDASIKFQKIPLGECFSGTFFGVSCPEYIADDLLEYLQRQEDFILFQKSGDRHISKSVLSKITLTKDFLIKIKHRHYLQKDINFHEISGLSYQKMIEEVDVQSFNKYFSQFLK